MHSQEDFWGKKKICKTNRLKITYKYQFSLTTGFSALASDSLSFPKDYCIRWPLFPL